MRLIASLGGAGFIPFAPGSWGSLIAVLLALPFFMLENGVVFLFGASAVAYIVGVYACNHWLAENGADDDPAAIVIDELVGQWLTLAIIAAFMVVGYVELISAFILFRFFDIVKPFPIGWVDTHIKGAHGIMLDDVLAGIIAGLTYLLIRQYI